MCKQTGKWNPDSGKKSPETDPEGAQLLDLSDNHFKETSMNLFSQLKEIIHNNRNEKGTFAGLSNRLKMSEKFMIKTKDQWKLSIWITREKAEEN